MKHSASVGLANTKTNKIQKNTTQKRRHRNYLFYSRKVKLGLLGAMSGVIQSIITVKIGAMKYSVAHCYMTLDTLHRRK
jgi:phosphoribosyl-AMP cyclohydrolase